MLHVAKHSLSCILFMAADPTNSLSKKKIYKNISNWLTNWHMKLIMKAKFKLDRLILAFIYYFNSKFKVTCKNGDFKCGTSKLIPKKGYKFCSITIAILHFFFCMKMTKLPPQVLWNLLFLMKPSETLQDGSFLPKLCKVWSLLISNVLLTHNPFWSPWATLFDKPVQTSWPLNYLYLIYTS